MMEAEETGSEVVISNHTPSFIYIFMLVLLFVVSNPDLKICFCVFEEKILSPTKQLLVDFHFFVLNKRPEETLFNEITT